ncbi:RHS repeat-associated core domain-containing protein [Mucilaginibacter mali]|uniref:RHS repeat-associated core domain-containing protein n=1 Tax=Mucilaginibacter mali TaxID=2740462 RepID=A0A7D4UDA0_9SPHI|nr:RHS repeat-associated core domain-containing protein [Mucilaginibacter mali]QKJ30359.1 RHS repeat-associated core domain-containing protein [Mucilaginibacter mali]
MLYSGSYSGSKSFTYGYDKLNRLITATSTGNTLDEGLTYDVMGNITNLTRGGQSYSSLTYGYMGNQLTGVTGSSFTTRSYAYDGNGNATSDGGSKSIDYNLLNLPRKVRNGSTELANYTYDATGNKLSNVSTSAGMNDGTWEYIDGIVYHNGSVAFISTEEGRAVPNGGGNYTYQYNLKDHLGNVRSTFYNNSGTATVLQEDEYYSFGLRHGLYDASTNNRYLYNGKELQTDLANQYDYGARFYDPVIGRWTSVDPLAEKSRRLSPYVYADNNPIRFIDPDGMATDSVNKKNTKETSYWGVGSYTITFENGMKYHGKGPYERARASAKRIGKANDTKVAEDGIDWEPAASDKQAFKDEDDRMNTDEGGHKSNDNYNKRASPGKAIKEQEKRSADLGESSTSSTSNSNSSHQSTGLQPGVKAGSVAVGTVTLIIVMILLSPVGV